MDIGERIKIARRRMGLTQPQLAEKCGLAAITIAQYERGKREPRYEQLERLADALDVPVEFLLGVGKIGTKNEITFGTEIEDFLQEESVRLGVPVESLKEILLNRVFDGAVLPISPQTVSFYFDTILGTKGTPREKLVSMYDDLNLLGQMRAINNLEDLTKVPEYRKVSLDDDDN